MTKNNKIFYLVIDLEADHGFKDQKQYQSLEFLNILKKHLKNRKIKATFFTTGYILEKSPDLLFDILNDGHELGIHSYSHRVDKTKTEAEQLKNVYDFFNSTFKFPPKGYHPPYNNVLKSELLTLTKLNLKYVLSDNFKPQNNIKNYQISRMRPFNIPLGMGFLNFIGKPFYSYILKNFNQSDNIIFYLHLHDLVNTQAYKALPVYFKVFYLKNRLFNNMENNFLHLLDIISKLGYDFDKLENHPY